MSGLSVPAATNLHITSLALSVTVPVAKSFMLPSYISKSNEEHGESNASSTTAMFCAKMVIGILFNGMQKFITTMVLT